MTRTPNPLGNRRNFLADTGRICVLSAAGLSSRLLGAATLPAGYKVCAYAEPIQRLPYGQAADLVARLGFSGIEATVRGGGQVEPERVEEDLPRLVTALEDQGLELTMMASGVGSVDDDHVEKVLRTATSLGIKRYRMRGYQYDLQRPVVEQLAAFRAKMVDLAALNAELGITGLYQNHSGASHVGATAWDLHQLIKDLDHRHIGVAFDISHATVEGGLAWPVHFNLLRPYMQIAIVKDFSWQGRNKWRWVPLGQGMIVPEYFVMLKTSGYRGPIDLHVEYDVSGVDFPRSAEFAYRRDFSLLQEWLDKD